MMLYLRKNVSSQTNMVMYTSLNVGMLYVDVSRASHELRRNESKKGEAR